jgi:hypothetical protein
MMTPDILLKILKELKLQTDLMQTYINVTLTDEQKIKFSNIFNKNRDQSK